MSDKKEVKYYNSGPSRSFIRLIEKNYPHVDINAILTYAGIEKHEVEAENYWFTQTQVDRFYEKASELCENDNLAYDAGKFALQSEGLGVFKYYFLTLGSIKQAYLRSAYFSNKLDRSAHYEAKMIGEKKVEITATPKPDVNHKLYQCQNRKGNIEQVPEIFGGKLISVEHEECIDNGKEKCRYIVSWEETIVSKLKPIKNRLFIVIPMISIILSVVYPQFVIDNLLITLATLLGIGWFVDRKEKKQLFYELENFRNLSSDYDEVLNQAHIMGDIVEIVRQIGEIIGQKAPIEETLENILTIILNHMDYDRGMFMFADNDAIRLQYKASVGFTQKDLNSLINTEFNLANPKTLRIIFVNSFLRKKPLVKDQPTNEDISFNNDIAQILQAETVICCPIILDGKSLGVIAIFEKSKRQRRFQLPVDLLMGIAPAIGKAYVD